MFTQILLGAFGIIVSGLATWLTTTLVKWFNSKIQNKEVAQLLSDITIITSNAIKATYQTYVSALKGTDAWTKEAQKEALHRAKETAKKELTSGAINYIEQNHGDLDEYLETLIESILYDLKVTFQK